VRKQIGLLVTVIVLLAAAASQRLPWQDKDAAAQDKDHQSVRYLFPEQITVVAGRPATVEMHFQVSDGMHVNSHTPREKNLIRTDLVVAEPLGIKIATVDFPEGSDYALAANPAEKLSVYTGDFVLVAHVTAQPGEHLVEGALRYQACDATSCYPPRKLPVAVDIIAR
jgi:hypothetical protein